ncbi:MAG: Ldh family oxidoreductase [Pararhodobacter sp.]
MPVVSQADLELFIAEALAAAGMPGPDALRAAAVFAEADASGVTTHGIARLGAYVGALEAGMINVAPQIAISGSEAIVVVDGDNGLGPVVASRAIGQAIEVARRFGVSLCLVQNSNHFGMASFYADRASAAGMVCIAFSNAAPTVAPHGGRAPVLGTNPIAASAPGGPAQPGVSMDFSTSTVSRGRIRTALRRGEALPEGWAVGPDGRPALTPEAAMEGALIGLGGPKGTGLAILADLLSGVLSGSAFSTFVGSMYGSRERPAGTGHAFLCIDIARARPEGDYPERWDRFAASLRDSAPLEDVPAVVLPGDRRARMRADSARAGIRLEAALWDECLELSSRLGIAPPIAS